MACDRAGQRDKAFSRFVEALRIDPDFADALMELGTLLDTAGRRAAAIACLRRATELLPQDGRIWCNLGFVLARAQRHAEAEQCLLRSAELLPDLPQPHHHLGSLLGGQGRLEEALSHFSRALSLAPDSAVIRFDRALYLLGAGDYARGWEDYEARLELLASPAKLPAPLWRGEALADKSVLVRHEQGFGDTIMFARLLPALARHGANVIFRVQPELVELMRTMRGSWRVESEADPLPGADFYCPLASLPHRLRLTADDIPIEPYLSAPANRKLQAPATAKQRIGLVWAASATSGSGPLRSISFAEILDLCGSSCCEFVSLQVGPNAGDIAAAGAQALVSDLSGILKNFADTAAVIDQLDLIVTVDTAVAHLAGAMGKRTFVVLPAAADWRWMRDRSDSPWYPSLRLFRQKKPGDWNDPLGEVREAIASLRDGA